MAENTLSQVAALPDVFDRLIVKTRMPAQERYALSFVHRDQCGTSLQATARQVLIAGLEAQGWDEARRVEEYAAYKAQCLRTGQRNEFESR